MSDYASDLTRMLVPHVMGQITPLTAVPRAPFLECWLKASFDNSWDGHLGQTGTAGGAAALSSTAKFGEAAYFAANSDYVTYGSTSFPMSAGTISTWEKHAWAVSDGVAHYLFSIKDGTKYLYLQKKTDDSLVAGFDDGTSYMATAASPTITANAWNHWALTWSVSDYCRVYLNGRLLATAGTVLGTMTLTTSLYIGGISGSSLGWVGYVDDFAVATRQLSADEVSAIYNSAAPIWAGADGAGGTAAPSNTGAVKAIVAKFFV